jgi:hypothetical protein
LHSACGAFGAQSHSYVHGNPTASGIGHKRVDVQLEDLRERLYKLRYPEQHLNEELLIHRLFSTNPFEQAPASDPHHQLTRLVAP